MILHLLSNLKPDNPFQINFNKPFITKLVLQMCIIVNTIIANYTKFASKINYFLFMKQLESTADLHLIFVKWLQQILI